MIVKSWIVAGLACVALSACEPGTGSAPLAGDAPGNAAAGGGDLAPAATSVRLVDHDVEAPEVFSASDKGLWDGRPSLGGVWVASADAKNPERVIMRNPANGKFVVGGLFQKDASLPGPKLQLSSDAADALGLVAGQPATISVTALRREETPPSAPDATKPLLDANEAVTPGGKTDVTATAAAAIAKADGLAGKPVAGKPAAGVAATPVVTAPLNGKPATPALAGKPATTTAAATAPAAGTNPTTAATKPAAVAASVKPVAAAAPAKPVTAAAANPVAPATPVVTAPAPAASGALIQIGIFSVEANAKRASDVLSKAGISATTSAETSHGKPLWSVTARGNAALLAKIKSAGFTDAYVLR